MSEVSPIEYPLFQINKIKLWFCPLFIFMQGDPLQVKVNKLSSTKTQLPYDYYFLKYCKPSNIRNSAENLGKVLPGDRIENSIYTVSVSLLFDLTSS